VSAISDFSNQNQTEKIRADTQVRPYNDFSKTAIFQKRGLMIFKKRGELIDKILQFCFRQIVDARRRRAAAAGRKAPA
jgi:hypothetical protein